VGDQNDISTLRIEDSLHIAAVTVNNNIKPEELQWEILDSEKAR
jgi:hypothetical protein